MSVSRFKPGILEAPVTIRRHAWESPLERIETRRTSHENPVNPPAHVAGFPVALRSLVRRLLPDGLKRLIKQAIR